MSKKRPVIDISAAAKARPGPLRRILHRFVPAHFNDPFGLALRLIRSGSPDARFAMLTALLGPPASLVDSLLKPLERRLYDRASAPRLPLIFVAGPPRSGTTLVEQTLIRCLPVTYVNNLTSLFPRSPIVANRLFGRPFSNASVGEASYYGRTRATSGPNDALYLWDRWLGEDRTKVEGPLSDPQRRALAAFFGAWETAFGKPLVTKNNNLNTCAHLVAEALPTSYFLCLEREEVYLAQSLLAARQEIHGSVDIPYGVDDPAYARADSVDPLEDVCRQVRFYREAARRQLATIGDRRFWRVSYERFCEDPLALVERVANEILGIELDPATAADRARPLTASRQRILPEADFDRLRQLLGGSEPSAS